MRFKIDRACLIVGSEFTVFALFYFVFEGNFPSTSPLGAYIWRGDLTEVFLRYEFGGLIFGGAYTWRGLFSEFYGILLGIRSLVGHLRASQNLTFPTILMSKNLAQVHNFTSWHGRAVNLVDCSVLCVERNLERVLL